MAMDQDPGGERLVLTFTGTHVTHGVAQALLGAYAGTLQADWPEGGAPLRVRWSR